MRILLDTNILLRLSSHQNQGRSALGQLVTQLGREHNLYVVPQCVYEMWSVMTRPVKANGWDLSPEQVAQGVERLLDTFPFLPDTPRSLGSGSISSRGTRFPGGPAMTPGSS